MVSLPTPPSSQRRTEAIHVFKDRLIETTRQLKDYLVQKMNHDHALQRLAGKEWREHTQMNQWLRRPNPPEVQDVLTLYYQAERKASECRRLISTLNHYIRELQNEEIIELLDQAVNDLNLKSSDWSNWNKPF